MKGRCCLLKSKDVIVDHHIVDGITVSEVVLGFVAFLCLTDRLKSHTGCIGRMLFMLVLVFVGGLLTIIYPPPGSSMPIHLRWVDGATVGFFLGCLGCLVCSKFLSRNILGREHIGYLILYCGCTLIGVISLAKYGLFNGSPDCTAFSFLEEIIPGSGCLLSFQNMVSYSITIFLFSVILYGWRIISSLTDKAVFIIGIIATFAAFALACVQPLLSFFDVPIK